MESNEPIAQHVPGLFSLHPSGPHFSNFIHVHDHLQSKSTNIVFLCLSFSLSLSVFSSWKSWKERGEGEGEEEKDDSAAVFGLVWGGAFGSDNDGENPSSKTGNHGVGSNQAWERPNGRENDQWNCFCGSDVEHLQHGQDPGTFR